MGEVEVGTG